MKRRLFLQATIVTAGSTALGMGCGGGDETPETTPDASTGADGTDPVGEPEDGTPVDGARFPQGIASGDPSSTSVILWTRLGLIEDGDGSVDLEMALDPGFTELLAQGEGTQTTLVAEAIFDHCVKVRMEGLEAGTTYYYRFLYGDEEDRVSSPVGQTRTAPDAGDDRAVRFAVASCQDYVGRYYNSYRRLAQEDVDFVLHLGDYVYETTGDDAFQDADSERAITFRHPEEAIVFGEGTDGEYYAARSLNNYRDLYRTFRGDPDLQAVHARAPFINIWDDHEFSDDCHGAHAVYFNDSEEDLDVDRRQAANQAWFEYMPVDYPGDPDFRYDPQVAFPGDLRIYRDLPYGKHLHLALTDLRTHRADHLIPERGYPGALALTEEELLDVFGEIPEGADPYIDVDTWAGGIYSQHLIAGGATEEEATGLVSARWINQILAALKEDLGEAFTTPLFAEEDFKTMS
ncbi:MAG: alkaline phosphatase D family protein, partial [Myxococcota bacterium]|nr:alkaline phosphatase D family protein [Myxococcota bacterium]